MPAHTNKNEIGQGLFFGSNQVLSKNWVTKFHGNESQAKKSIGLHFIIFCVATRGCTL
jgi:hypothetical protein